MNSNINLFINKFLSYGKIIAANTLILFVLLELFGAAYFYQETSQLFYLRNNENARARLKDVVPEKSVFNNTSLHPYFGFVRRTGQLLTEVVRPRSLDMLFSGASEKQKSKWSSLKTNNFGYFSTSDYPRKKRNEREYIIGVFGGSVAHWLAIQGTEVLQEKLKSYPAFADKELVVLNFAQGSFKQPQQMLSLNYFLMVGQEFDAVVNIYGFNEVAFAKLNQRQGVSISMPSSKHILGLITLLNPQKINPDTFHLYYELQRTKAFLSFLNRQKAKTKLASVYAIADFVSSYFEKQLANQNLEIDSKTLELGLNRFSNVSLAESNSDEKHLTTLFQQLKASAELMNASCEKLGIKYLEVIQPSQYYSKKTFTEFEKEKAILVSRRAKAINTAYPLMHQYVKELSDKGVDIVSAITLFDTTKSSIYVDNCCHYNQLGNELLAEFVAENINRSFVR